MAHKCSNVKHSTEKLKQKQGKKTIQNVQNVNSEFQRKCAGMEIGVMQFIVIIFKRKHLQ